jgi:hypothetical protein
MDDLLRVPARDLQLWRKPQSRIRAPSKDSPKPDMGEVTGVQSEEEVSEPQLPAESAQSTLAR